MSSTQFRVLGPLEVEREGEPIAIGAPKERALLLYLLLSDNRVVRSKGSSMPSGQTSLPPRPRSSSSSTFRISGTSWGERRSKMPSGYRMEVEPPHSIACAGSRSGKVELPRRPTTRNSRWRSRPARLHFGVARRRRRLLRRVRSSRSRPARRGSTRLLRGPARSPSLGNDEGSPRRPGSAPNTLAASGSAAPHGRSTAPAARWTHSSLPRGARQYRPVGPRAGRRPPQSSWRSSSRPCPCAAERLEGASRRSPVLTSLVGRERRDTRPPRLVLRGHSSRDSRRSRRKR